MLSQNYFIFEASFACLYRLSEILLGFYKNSFLYWSTFGILSVVTNPNALGIFVQMNTEIVVYMIFL